MKELELKTTQSSLEKIQSDITDPVEMIEQLLAACSKECRSIVPKSCISNMEFGGTLSGITLVFKHRLVDAGELNRLDYDTFKFKSRVWINAFKYKLKTIFGIDKLPTLTLDGYGKSWYVEQMITCYSSEFYKNQESK